MRKRTVSLVLAILLAAVCAACSRVPAASGGESAPPVSAAPSESDPAETEGPETALPAGTETAQPDETESAQPAETETAQPNASEEPGLSGEIVSWGIYSIFVPDSMDFQGGSQIDADSIMSCRMSGKENPFHIWLMADAVSAESAAGSLQTTKELNEGAQDFNYTLNGRDWTGICYKIGGTEDAFAMYSDFNGQTIFIRCVGWAYDGEMTAAVIGDMNIADVD